MLATAEAGRRGLRGDVILTAVSDEEFASVGTEAIAASVRADAAIVTEQEMGVAVAHRGFVNLEVETIGVRRTALARIWASMRSRRWGASGRHPTA